MWIDDSYSFLFWVLWLKVKSQRTTWAKASFSTVLTVIQQFPPPSTPQKNQPVQRLSAAQSLIKAKGQI